MVICEFNVLKNCLFPIFFSPGPLSRTMGAVSKVIASTVTYPLQLIKSRLQQRTQITELTIDGEIQIVRREYSGVMDCVRRIWRHEGFVGFFKGTIPNAVRVAPSSAITFVVYESVTDFLTKKGA